MVGFCPLVSNMVPRGGPLTLVMTDGQFSQVSPVSVGALHQPSAHLGSVQSFSYLLASILEILLWLPLVIRLRWPALGIEAWSPL